MKRPSTILTLTVVVAFYWTLPARAFSFTPRFDHPVVMAKPDGPYDRWFVPPQPSRLCITDRRSAIVADATNDESHPAWMPFAFVASWSLMIIVDRSDRTALETLELVHYATPILFAATTVFALIAFDNESELSDTENDEVRGD